MFHNSQEVSTGKRGGLFFMIQDCKECANVGSELCKSCVETSGGKPSNFKPK